MPATQTPHYTPSWSATRPRPIRYCGRLIRYYKRSRSYCLRPAADSVLRMSHSVLQTFVLLAAPARFDTADVPFGITNAPLRTACGPRPIRYCGRPIRYYKRLTSYCLRPTPDSVVRTSHSVLQTLHFVLLAAYARFRIAGVQFSTTNSPLRIACGPRPIR